MKSITAIWLFFAASLCGQTLGGAIAHKEFFQVWGSTKLSGKWLVSPQYLMLTPEKEKEGHKENAWSRTHLGSLQVGRTFTWGEHEPSTFTPTFGLVTNGSKAGLAFGERLTFCPAEHWEVESHVTVVKLPGTGKTFLASEPLLEVTRRLIGPLRAGAGVDIDYAFEKPHVESGPVLALSFRRTQAGGQALFGKEGAGWKVFCVHRF